MKTSLRIRATTACAARALACC